MWIDSFDFLLNRSQIVKIGQNYSKSLVTNTGSPQGCTLSPVLYFLITHDCVTNYGCNFMVKFVHATTPRGMIEKVCTGQKIDRWLNSVPRMIWN